MARRVQEREIELLPEADRLEGFPHPRETYQLFGHDAAEAELRRAFDGGRMHHAWILAGRAGIGKATLAYRFAAYVLARGAERGGSDDGLWVVPNSVAARQVRARSHPRLLVIRRPYDIKAKRFSASIPVDAVRSVRGFLSSRGEAADWRVVLVDTGDELNVNAANALLKSLEEPPPRTIFLLVSSEPGRLLNTIRSRCRRLEIQQLKAEDLKAAVNQAIAAAEAKTIDEKAFEALLPLSGGSVRRLLSLHALDGAKLASQIRTMLDRLPDVDWGRVHTLADQLAPVAAAEKFDVFVELLLGAVGEAIRGSVSAPTAPQSVSGQAGLAPAGFVRAIAAGGRPDRWVDAWEATVDDRAELMSLNLDRKGFLIETVGRLARTASGR